LSILLGKLLAKLLRLCYNKGGKIERKGDLT
jgi:hypothetical protein